MSVDDKITNGEIYRRLCDMDERYEKQLERIEAQVRTTNGRTTTLEANFSNLKALVNSLLPKSVSAGVAVETGESLSIRLSPKLWTVLAAAGGVLFAMAIEWAKRKLGQP